MAFVEKAVVLLMMIMVAAQVSNAAEYKVGDSAGWTTIGNIDYKKWAAEKNFKFGDTIIFEYKAQFHNVIRVKNHTMYMKCDASDPLETYTTGNDTIKMTHYGHHFFLCGIPGHCQLGQRVDINVIKPSPPATSPSPPPTKSPSPPATSPSPPTKSPSAPTTSPSAPTTPPAKSPSPPTNSPSPPTTSPLAPAPAKSPSASDSPAPVSNTPSPSPSRSNASRLNVGKGAYGFVGLAMTVFSIFYF